jgi:hypothetical protein
MGLLAFLFGACSKHEQAKPAAPTAAEITLGSGEGFVDLSFAIRNVEALPDGSQVLEVFGTHNGREVGIKLALGTKWKQGKLGPLDTFTGVASYQSLGQTTEAFVQDLDELYRTKLHPTTVRPSTTFTAISLEGNPARLENGPTKLKLFFESDDENRYAELYTNIDLAKRVLEFHEKDPTYRVAIIKALTIP